MFVPYNFGFWTHPGVMELEQLTRDPNAGAYFCRLKEYAMTNTTAGELPAKGERVEAIARWRGKRGQLLAFLLRSDLLERRAGGVFIAGWEGDPAGKYEEERAEDAKRKRDARQRRLGGPGTPPPPPPGEDMRPPDVHRTSTGRPGDVQGTSGVRKEGRKEDGPPEAPQGGADAIGAEWDWFKEQYPALVEERKTRELFYALSDEDRAWIRFALPKQLLGSRWKNKRFIPLSAKYLRREQWKEVKRPKVKPEAPPVAPEVRAQAKAAREAAAVAEEVEQRARRRNYCERLLADPDAKPPARAQAEAQLREIEEEERAAAAAQVRAADRPNLEVVN